MVTIELEEEVVTRVVMVVDVLIGFWFFGLVEVDVDVEVLSFFGNAINLKRLLRVSKSYIKV